MLFLLQPLLKFPVRHINCSCVCTIENQNEQKNVQCHHLICNKDSLANSCTWQHQCKRPMPYTNHSTTQIIKHCSRLTSKLATAISYLIKKIAHSYFTKLFVCCQTQKYCNGQNYTSKNLKRKVRYHFPR